MLTQQLEVKKNISLACNRNDSLGLLADFRKPEVMARYHWHPQVEVNILYQGWIECAFNDQVVRISAPQICLFWAPSPHKVSAVSEDSRFGLLHIPMNLLLSWNIDQNFVARVLNGHIIIVDDDDFISKEELLRWQRYIALDDLQITQLVEDELQLMVRRLILLGGFKPDITTKCQLGHRYQRGISENSKKNIQIMLAYIAANYLLDIDVSDVATRVRLHPKYAMNLFKKTLCISIKRYIVMLRLSHAKQLLLDTEIAIQEVALQSGFKQQSSFFAAFKSHVGETPQSFRQSLR